MASNALKGSFIRHVGARSYAQAAPAVARKDAKLQHSVLPNKTFVAALDNGAPVTRVTVAFKAGSRYESPSDLGLAHVLRSAAGLTTTNASSFIIARKLAQAGASATKENLSPALECLNNLVSNQEFRPWELSDNVPRLKYDIAALGPQVRAVDLLHKAAFRRGLGNSLFISPKKIGKVSSESMQHFACSTLTPARCAVTVVGDAHDRAAMIAQALQLPSGESKGEPGKFFGALGNGPVTKWGADLSPLAKAIGNIGPFAAAGFNVSYSDNGLFGVVLSVPKDEANNAIKAVAKVLKSSSLSADAIKAGKSQLKVQLLSEADDGASLAESLAAQGLYTGSVKSPGELAAIIEQISSNDDFPGDFKCVKNDAGAKLSRMEIDWKKKDVPDAPPVKQVIEVFSIVKIEMTKGNDLGLDIWNFPTEQKLPEEPKSLEKVNSASDEIVCNICFSSEQLESPSVPQPLCKNANVLIPGGATYFNQSNGYADAGQHIYELAMELNDAGDYFPIFGTCLGFELLIILASGRGEKENRITCYSFENIPLHFTSVSSPAVKHPPLDPMLWKTRRSETVERWRRWWSQPSLPDSLVEHEDCSSVVRLGSQATLSLLLEDASESESAARRVSRRLSARSSRPPRGAAIGSVISSIGGHTTIFGFAFLALAAVAFASPKPDPQVVYSAPAAYPALGYSAYSPEEPYEYADTDDIGKPAGRAAAGATTPGGADATNAADAYGDTRGDPRYGELKTRGSATADANTASTSCGSRELIEGVGAGSVGVWASSVTDRGGGFIFACFLAVAAAKPLVVSYASPVAAAYTAPVAAAYTAPLAYSAYSAYTAPVAYSAYGYAAPYSAYYLR
ncbi:hypothetical protein MSG28_005223 [Choristoneura fumiferana]|uniref:Uncharacterized protein n=1 Tax=Choristoneura fumiferana TaxID=7141 RepID=A0ACC0JR32_CHOFU|nr:hypothetical protein MSG28_005223 [Choristoneura fumiferana]